MPAEKASDIAPFIGLDVLGTALAMERDDRESIRLKAAEPDFVTAQCSKEACREALRDGKTRHP